MSDFDGAGTRWHTPEPSQEGIGNKTSAPTNKVSILNIYKLLSTYMMDYEKSLKDSLGSIKGQAASEIDQGVLLELQAMVQTWGTISATSTGIVRSIGDTLSKITQNIR
ncbi:MAG: hypothetical protein LBB20_01780 [Puniceicoccales bacterium]|jgi:hypothetical protein|nr:hypothetical protein [Puniceicoccales bacterium]